MLRETAQTPEEDLEALQDIEPPPLLQHEQPVARPARAGRGDARARRRARPADDPQREDGRPDGQVLARGLPARDGDGRGDPGVRGRRARCACRARASPRSRRPTTCSRCARTPTCSTDDARVSCSPRARRPRAVRRRSTPTTSSCMRDFDARFPDGPPSLVECDRFVVEGDVRFGAGVVVRGDVTVRQEGDEPLTIEDGAVLEDDEGGPSGATLAARPPSAAEHPSRMPARLSVSPPQSDSRRRDGHLPAGGRALRVSDPELLAHRGELLAQLRHLGLEPVEALVAARRRRDDAAPARGRAGSSAPRRPRRAGGGSAPPSGPAGGPAGPRAAVDSPVSTSCSRRGRRTAASAPCAA